MDNQEKPATSGAQTPEALVQGPRGVGAYGLPSGATVSHEITADGMKQTLVTGSEHVSAAHFHAERGVATEAEQQKVDDEAAEARAREEALKNAPVIDPHQ